MKEIFILLLVPILCPPAMAATITVVDNQTTPPTVTVTVATEAGEPNIVGVALDVDLDQGVVTAVSVDTANFNIYPDAAYTEEVPAGDGYIYGECTPVCAQNVAGEIALPLRSFCLSFADLNGENTPGADGAASVSVTLTLDDVNSIKICENALRGGIVAVDGTALDASCDVTIPPPFPCCMGDLDGNGQIDGNDLAALIQYLIPHAPSYTVNPTPPGDEQYDLDSNGQVDGNDMSALIAHLTPYAPSYVTYDCMPCMP